MKKNNLTIWIVYTITGLILILLAALTDSKLGHLLFTFASVVIVLGLIRICKHFYWNKPENSEQYKKKLEHENIEQHDELKIKLRDKSGRYAYVAGLMVISISMMAFSVLGTLEIVENSNTIVLYLGGYFVFQIIIGIVIFNYLLKKY